MSGLPAWSEAKLAALGDQLTGFWVQDKWGWRQFPIPARQHRGGLCFTCVSPSLNIELKYACWQLFVSNHWSVQSWKGDWLVHRMIRWLNQITPPVSSFLDHPAQYWETSLCSYLIAHGQLETGTRTALDSSQQIRRYPKADRCLVIFRQIYKTVLQAYDDREEYDKEVWDLRKLGIPLNLSKSDYKLTFVKITQPWLNHAVKQFMRYSLSTLAAETCRGRVAAFTMFSQFLRTHAPHLQAQEIDRPLIIAYMKYLAAANLQAVTRAHYLSCLRDFLEVCAREGWAMVPDKRFIYHEDFPHREKAQPRFLPQEVVDQLNQCLEAFPPQIMRMILVIQECGMRVCELCSLPFHCLMQDTSGDWFLRWYQSKMYKEHSVPISKELVLVIQEQQQEVRTRWEQEIPWLFPNGKGQSYKQSWFVDELNRVAYEKQIRDHTGTLYHFQSHQFRHTLGTRMINSGVPQHIVQRYLGHESPRMTAVYAFIHDQTLKEEYMRFRGKTVDVTGKVIEAKGRADESSIQWIKKNILAQALPNGSCALPIVAGTCPHANACLTCVHFRTDASFLPQHKTQLQETQQFLQVARVNGWQRQTEMNEKVMINLEHIIATLEEPEHDT